MTALWYQEVHISSWEEARHFRKHLTGAFLFRGQHQAAWPLETTMGRVYRTWSIQSPDTLHEAERDTIKKLKSQGPNYGTRLPTGQRDIEWLALLQHHGGCTRLLEVTSSFFVAAFFAFENPSNGSHAIWWVKNWDLVYGAYGLLNPGSVIEECFPDQVHVDAETAFATDLLDVELLNGPSVELVLPVIMDFRSQRMQAQQGSFIASTAPADPLERGIARTLRALNKTAPEAVMKYTMSGKSWKSCWNNIAKASVVKLTLDDAVRQEAMVEREEMNVTSSSLFPGLMGLRSH